MTTELDELANRAENDSSLSSTGLDRVIASVIEQTRRHWATMSDQYAGLTLQSGSAVPVNAQKLPGKPR